MRPSPLSVCPDAQPQPLGGLVGLNWIVPHRPVWSRHRRTLELEQRLTRFRYILRSHRVFGWSACLIPPSARQSLAKVICDTRVMTGLNIS